MHATKHRSTQLLALTLAGWLAGGLTSCQRFAAPDLVDVAQVAPGIRVELRYATTNNFTGQRWYPADRCLLRRPVAKRLARVQADLARHGFGLKVYDAYRPLAVQRRMWGLVPDERYVANPAKGSRHNRGAAVDVTLVRPDGTELPMPTPFDDFSERAGRYWSELPAVQAGHRLQLERAMRRRGFVGLRTEWWHFDDPRWQRYPVLDLPLEGASGDEGHR